jgi:hypothetical protein
MRISKPLINAVVLSILTVLTSCGPDTKETAATAVSNPVPTVTEATALQGKNVVAEIFTGEW